MLQYDCVKRHDLRSVLATDFGILRFPAHVRYQLKQAIEDRENDRISELLEDLVDFDDDDSLLDLAIRNVNSYAIQELLKRRDTKLEDLPLHEFQSCLQLLLDHPKTDINEINQINGKHILHTAPLYSDDIALELLKQEALLGAKSKEGEIAVRCLSANVLNKFFNHCIERHDFFSVIEITYRTLLPTEPNNISSNNCEEKCTEMQIIAEIANSEEKSHLLEHPFITTFLVYKWSQLSPLFYLNFWLYVIFAISYVTQIMLKSTYHETTASVLLTWLGIVYLIIRECLQLILGFREYIRSPSNYAECLMIILSIVLCSGYMSNLDRNVQNALSVIVILLITIELVQFLGSLPHLSFSKRIHLFKVVFENFLKSFLLYSVFVVSFSLCFYITVGTEAEPDGDLNSFNNIWKALLKSTVMMIGELDANDLKLEGFSYGLLFLFIFVVTTVLYNLINGVAISDILKIESEAKIEDIRQRIKLISKLDRAIEDNWKFSERVLNIGIFHWLKSVVKPIRIDRIEFRIDNKNSKDLVAMVGDLYCSKGHRLPRSIRINKKTARQILNIAMERENKKKPVSELKTLAEKMDKLYNIVLEKLNGNKESQ